MMHSMFVREEDLFWDRQTKKENYFFIWFIATNQMLVSRSKLLEIIKKSARLDNCGND